MMKILIAVQDRLFDVELATFLQHYKCDEATEICVLHAIKPPLGACHVDPQLLERVKKRDETAIDNLVTGIKRLLPQAQVRGLVIEGNPQSTILAQARKLGADLIVLGAHRRSTIGKFFLGSVSLPVLEAAPCSTLVLRQAGPIDKHLQLHRPSALSGDVPALAQET